MKKRISIFLLGLCSLVAVSVYADQQPVGDCQPISTEQYCQQVPCDTVPCNPCDTTCNPAPCTPAPCNPGC